MNLIKNARVWKSKVTYIEYIIPIKQMFLQCGHLTFDITLSAFNNKKIFLLFDATMSNFCFKMLIFFYDIKTFLAFRSIMW